MLNGEQTDLGQKVMWRAGAAGILVVLAMLTGLYFLFGTAAFVAFVLAMVSLIHWTGAGEGASPVAGAKPGSPWEQITAKAGAVLVLALLVGVPGGFATVSKREQAQTLSAEQWMAEVEGTQAAAAQGGGFWWTIVWVLVMFGGFVAIYEFTWRTVLAVMRLVRGGVGGRVLKLASGGAARWWTSRWR